MSFLVGALTGLSSSIGQTLPGILYDISRYLRIFLSYIRTALHYIWRYLTYAFQMLQKFYLQFQKDPINTLSAIGSIIILFNAGVFG